MAARKATRRLRLRDHPRIETPPRKHNLMRRVVTLVRPHWPKFAVTVALSFGITLAALCVPYAFGQSINAITAKDEQRIIILGLAVIGAGLIRALLAAATKLVGGSLSLDVEMDIRNRIFSHVSRLDAAYFERVPSGEIVSRILVASGPVQSFLGFGLPRLMCDVIKILLTAVVMISISPMLALAGLWAMPLALGAAVHYGWKVTPLMVDVQARMADVTVEAEASLLGFMGTKLSHTQYAWIHRFSGATRRWFDARVRVNGTVANHESSIVALPEFGLATLLLISGFQVIDGTLSLGTFVTLAGVLGVAVEPIKNAGASLWSMQHALASAQRAFEILDVESTIKDDPNAAQVRRSAIDLKFDSISHSYPAGGSSLRRIEFDIAAGRNVGIIGRAGSGKSSLLSLVYRLYDPTQGSVRLGGRTAGAVELNSLRNLVRFVGRRAVIFPGTIADNVLYGNASATRDEVVAALELVGADKFLSELPRGVDSPADTRVLRPAMQQMISLARAIVTRPGILLIDDATSYFSIADEAQLARNMSAALVDTTIVAVVRRRSLVALADEFILLDSGELVAAGSLEQLAEASPEFSGVFHSWSDTPVDHGSSS